MYYNSNDVIDDIIRHQNGKFISKEGDFLQALNTEDTKTEEEQK